MSQSDRGGARTTQPPDPPPLAPKQKTATIWGTQAKTAKARGGFNEREHQFAGGGGITVLKVARGLSIALLGAALALLALSGAGAEYRLAQHPTTGECAYLNTAGAWDAAGEWLYTGAQAAAAEACALPAPPPAQEAPPDDIEPLVGVARPVINATATSVLTAHGRALRDVEEVIATNRNQLVAAQTSLNNLPPSAPGFVRNLFVTQINTFTQAIANAEVIYAGLIQAAAGEPRTRTSVTLETTQHVEIDSDGDGVWETHNCSGRQVDGRILRVGVGDDGNDLPYADELRRACNAR